MKIILFFFLLLFFCSCANSSKKSENEVVEDEFVPPPNPFSDNGADSIILDTSGRAKKAVKPGMKPPKIAFEKKELVFDTIPAAKVFKAEIVFSNSGEQALEITSVRSKKQADLNWSRLLIDESEESKIIYKIKAPEKKGIFRDSIFIISNAGEDKILLKGTVR